MDGWRSSSNKRVDAAMFDSNEGVPPKRSSGALKHRRVQLPWPEDREFRILAIDGGGIRGIFPATFLAGLEERYLGGVSVAQYFDLIAGTSTGGIIALGLASGLTAAEQRNLYIERGCDIFPPIRSDVIGSAKRCFWSLYQYFKFRYDREALMCILRETFEDRKFGEAQTRLCIPSFDGRHGEVYIFKTPHHPDFRKDAKEPMIKVAAATSAAPTFFQPFKDGGYTFVDGGVWANNPIMVALVDALSCFSVPRERIRVLSLGCGDDQYAVGKMKTLLGGMLAWKDIIYGAMRLQSLNALGQAGLLVGADRIIRVNAPTCEKKIRLDDWSRAVAELPNVAKAALDEFGENAASVFLMEPAAPYRPIVAECSL
ncbi:MAG: patatin-like phospholipase family protein [Gemmatimonadetes bacterium]|nr:patatin-like phospholipase family protein [Gemmatimonadota bacterium]